MLKSITIDSVLGGQSPARYFTGQGQFLASIGVDPDFPIVSSDYRTSGAIVPTVYTKFSGSNVNAAPIAILNDPKDTKTYVVLTNGRIVSYDSALSNETLVGTVSGNLATGAGIYNNYLYVMTGTDVSRFGPLNNSPSLVDGVWTGSTLGSQTATVNTTYPSIRNVTLPNHWGVAHGDGAYYFLDFKNGQGMVHKIKTTKGTDEGDTNNGSGYNVLDLPFGFYPTSISSYSTDIVISAVQTTDSTVNQGKAALFFWDTTNTDTFYRGPVYLPDPLVTALLYLNGILYIWSGNAQNGVRVSQYAGGDVVTDIAFFETGAPPLAGAVDALGNRLVWGGYTVYPAASASVFALRSKASSIPQGIHNIVKSTSSGANQNVTALKYTQQSSNIIPKLVVGWHDDSASGMDSQATTGTCTSVINLPLINVGSKFTVKKVRIPLGAAVASNMQITPTLLFDDESSSQALDIISTTLFSGKRYALYKPGSSGYGGRNNVILQLQWAGSVPLPVTLPITMELDVADDESNA